MKNLLIIATFVWFALSSYWYVCNIKGLCKQDLTRVVDENGIEVVDRNLVKNKPFEVMFAPNSTSIINSTELEKYVSDLSKSGKFKMIGFTANLGNYAAGYDRLALARANTVKAMFVSKGVAPEKIVVEAKGIESPKSENNSEEGRAKNRRVEIQIIEE